MTTFLYVLAGFAIGFEAGRYASGKEYNWKRALIAGAVALLAGAIAAYLLGGTA